MDRLVALAVDRRFLMVGLFAAVLIGGLIAFNRLNIEAYPDPTPPLVAIAIKKIATGSISWILELETPLLCGPAKS